MIMTRGVGIFWGGVGSSIVAGVVVENTTFAPTRLAPLWVFCDLASVVEVNASIYVVNAKYLKVQDARYGFLITDVSISVHPLAKERSASLCKLRVLVGVLKH